MDVLNHRLMMQPVLLQVSLNHAKTMALLDGFFKQQAQMQIIQKQELILQLKQYTDQVKQMKLELEQCFSETMKQQHQIFEQNCAEQNLKFVEMFHSLTNPLQTNLKEQKLERSYCDRYVRDILSTNCSNWNLGSSGRFKFQLISGWVQIFTLGIPFTFQNLTTSQALERFCHAFSHSSNQVSAVTTDNKLCIEVIADSKEFAQELLDRYISNDILHTINKDLGGMKLDAVELIEAGMITESNVSNLRSKLTAQVISFSIEDNKMPDRNHSLLQNQPNNVQSKDTSNRPSYNASSHGISSSAKILQPHENLEDATSDNLNQSNFTTTNTGLTSPSMNVHASSFNPSNIRPTNDSTQNSHSNPFLGLFKSPNASNKPVEVSSSSSPSQSISANTGKAQVDNTPSVSLKTALRTKKKSSFNENKIENEQESVELQSKVISLNKHGSAVEPNKPSSMLTKKRPHDGASRPTSVSSIILTSFSGEKLHINVLFLRVQLKQRIFSSVQELQDHLAKDKSFSMNDCWVEKRKKDRKVKVG